jgi:hypothetical protein
MSNALNMNELIGTSYYFLKQYFGKDVINTNYNDFLLDGLREKINKKNQETGAIIEEKVEEIVGTQSVGTMVLENKKGDEVARMNLTELPTLFSNMTTSSVGLEMVPGKVVENVDTKAKEELKIKTRIVEEKKLEVEKTNQIVLDLKNKLDTISNPEEKKQLEEELQKTQTAQQIAVLEEQKAKSLLEEESKKAASTFSSSVITSGLNIFAPPATAPAPEAPATAAAEVVPTTKEEEKPIEPQLVTVAKEQLTKAVEENKKEKENQEREHQYKLDQIKQRLTIAGGNKNVADRQLKEAQDKYNNSGGLFNFGNKDEKLKKIVEEKEKEKEKAYEEYKIWLVKYNEATLKDRERKKKEKEAAEKRKLYDEIANRIKQGSIKELYQIEKEDKIQTSNKLPAIMEGDENETEETKETKDKLVAILEEDETEEDNSARQKALAEYLVSNVSRSGIETIRNKLVNIEKNTITDLTQAKNQLEMIQKKRKEFDLSNLDSIDKINSLRQKNNALKTSLDTIHEDIELKTEEYVKVLLETQATENKEIKNDTIKTLTDEIYQIYDSETLEIMNVDLILKSKEGELKKKEEEDRKQKEEEEANKKLSEQQKAKQMEEVETIIRSSLAKIQQTKQTLNDAIDSIQQISIPKSNNDSFINFLNKQISTIETSVKELERLYDPIQTALNTNNLSQSEEIKTKYPDIFDIDVVIQKGKETLELAKGYLKTEEEKREKIKALKPEIATLSKEIKAATTQIRDLGITLADKDTSTEEAQQIFETINTLYKTIKIKNDTLQTKIGSEIIIQENEVIKELIETIDVRFETVQGLMEERKGKVEVNRPNISTSRSKIGWENTDMNTYKELDEEIPTAQTNIIPPEPLFTKNNLTKNNRIRLTLPSNKLNIEDLEGDGLENVGSPLQPTNVSTEEDYDKTYKELQDEIKNEKLKEPQEVKYNETPRKGPVKDTIKTAQKTAKNMLLNKNKLPKSKFKFTENNPYARMTYGGKKTTKHRPTKNKTKKRHT